jgi:hypothetical protein
MKHYIGRSPLVTTMTRPANQCVMPMQGAMREPPLLWSRVLALERRLRMHNQQRRERLRGRSLLLSYTKYDMPARRESEWRASPQVR